MAVGARLSMAQSRITTGHERVVQRLTPRGVVSPIRMDLMSSDLERRTCVAQAGTISEHSQQRLTAQDLEACISDFLASFRVWLSSSHLARHATGETRSDRPMTVVANRFSL